MIAANELTEERGSYRRYPLGMRSGSALDASGALCLVATSGPKNPLHHQGSFKVGVTAWRRGDTPVWVYKPGGHGVFLDRGGWLTSTAIEWEPRRARLCIFPPPGR